MDPKGSYEGAKATIGAMRNIFGDTKQVKVLAEVLKRRRNAQKKKSKEMYSNNSTRKSAQVKLKGVKAKRVSERATKKNEKTNKRVENARKADDNDDEDGDYDPSDKVLCFPKPLFVNNPKSNEWIEISDNDIILKKVRGVFCIICHVSFCLFGIFLSHIYFHLFRFLRSWDH